MKTLRLFLFGIICSSAFAQPTPPTTGSLQVNTTTGAITNPISAATFKSANGIGGGGSGDVVGPSSATDNAIARFDLATGKLIQNSVGLLSDTGALTGITSLNGLTFLANATGFQISGGTSSRTLTVVANINTGTTNGTLASGAFASIVIKNVKDYGVTGDGTTNDTDAIAALLASNTRLYFPPGTYLCGVRSDAGTTLFPIGNLSNIEFCGDGEGSILKLANGMARAVVMFGCGSGQTISSIQWHDLYIDLNGPNNLQTAFDNPLRLNSFIYANTGLASDISIRRVFVRNGSGSQLIRITDDSSTLPKRINIEDCTFYGFGLGITNNFSYDTSVIYVFGDAVTVSGCHFLNDAFTFDTAHGLTGVEYHSGTGAVIVNNTFVYTQGPVLLVATAGDVNNALVQGNSMTQCMNSFLLSGFVSNDLNRITIDSNRWFSSIANQAGTFFIGDVVDPNHHVRDLNITNNVFTSTSTAVGKAGILLVSAYYDSIRIIGNTFRGFTAPAIYMAGEQFRNTATMEISRNIFDSCGPNASGSPYFPSTADAVAIVVSPSTTAALNALIIDNNLVTNNDGRDYATFKGFYLGANLRANTIFVRNNTKSGDSTAAVVSDAGASATQFYDVRTLTPQPLATLGTSTTLLHGNATGPPAFAVVAPADASGNTNGSGNFVLTTSPTLVTPVLGAATGTSLNLSGTAIAGAVQTAGTYTLTGATSRLYFDAAQTNWLDRTGVVFTFRDNNNVTGLTINGNASTFPGTVNAATFAGAGTSLTGTGASFTAGAANSVALGNITGAGTGFLAAGANATNATNGLATYVLGSSSAFGLVKVDGTSITASGGVISATGGTGNVTNSGTLTSTAFATGAGTTVIQTPSATSTLDSSGNAAFAGNLTVGTSNKITAGTIELGAASDTTIARVSAGVISVEGATIFSTTTKTDVVQGAQLVTLSSSSTDTYVGTAGVTITGYVTGTHYTFVSNTANTGAASININTIGAKTIVKVAGGVTTALADNDIRSGQVVDLVYDGTNMQIQSLLGNAPAGAATLTSTQVGYGDGSNVLTGEAAFNYTAATNILVVGGVTLGAGSEVSSIGPLVDSVDGTTPLNNIIQTVASGTAYTMTTSYAALDFGTTDPVLTIANAGTYAIYVQVQTSLVSATTTTQSVTFKLRRTNNTAADLAGSTFGQPLPVATIGTEGGPSTSIGPIKYTTSGTTDTITVQGILSASLGAGTVTASDCTITAIRMY